MNPIALPFPPDPQRPSYRDGMLLDSSDFQDEQGYHRGQLARALQRLHGYGTAAGLQMIYYPKGSVRAEDNTVRTEEEIGVGAGIAVDRLGRFIEVTQPQYLRLGRWFTFQTSQHPEKIVPFRDGAGQRFLVADAFIAFLEADQGLRPSFPDAAVEASDAVVPSRTLDTFELVLEPRRCDPATSLPPVPAKRFAAPPTTRQQLLDAVYSAYQPPAPIEYPPQFGDDPADTTAVFISRIQIRLLDDPDTSLTRNASLAVTIDDSARPLIPAADALLALVPTT